MERRDVLRSASGLLTAGTAGLAGCSGGNDDGSPTGTASGSGVCQPPDGPLVDALPDDYDRQGDVTTSDGSHDEGIERTAYALYRVPEGGEYYCSITEFSSPAAADEGTRRTRAEGGHSNAVLGLVQFGRYVFFAAGPDRQTVRDVLGATSLSEACLASSFTVVSGTATPEPI